MSGLALVMKGMGFKVQGSDINLNKNIERLKQDKIKVFIGHEKKNVSQATIIVISSAVKKNNIEVVLAKQRKLPIYKRGDMLGHITSLTKNIVVVGSHGKTTTTSLVSSILSSSNLDPTIINGGVLKSSNNSARLGKSNWSIVELDESDGSFLKVQPTYSIITNIDREHMDYYKSMQHLKNLFIEFISKVPSFGKTFICIDNKNNLEILKKIKAPFSRLSYSDCVDILKKDGFDVEWGDDFGSPEETHIAEKFDSPVIVHRFPSKIKAFYMKRDPENDKVVLGMDILAPEGYGEIVGGSERETDIEILLDRIKVEGLNQEDYDWFLDLRRFGSVPHSGFGMGLERVVAWLCGLTHIRETTPFARTMGRLNP